MLEAQNREGKSKKRSGKKWLLISVLIFMILFVSFLILKSSFKSGQNFAAIDQKNILINEGVGASQAPSDPGAAAGAGFGSILRLIKKITLDLSILRDWRFSSLVEYGRPPVVNEKGRANPFDPY